MATAAATQVVSSVLSSPSPMANGLQLEVWQVAGGSVADTITIVPKWGKYVVSVQAPMATHDVSTNGSNTNVTLTLTVSAATNAYSDVWVLTRP